MEMRQEMVKNESANFFPTKTAIASSENVGAVKKSIPAGNTFGVKVGVDIDSIPGIRIGNAVIHNTGIAFWKNFQLPRNNAKGSKYLSVC